MNTQWKPKIWLTVLTGLFFQPFVFLYVNRSKLFWLYFFLIITTNSLDLILHQNLSNIKWFEYIYISSLFILICPIHGYLIVKKYDPVQQRGWYARWWTGTTILLPVILALIFVLEPFYTSNSSMQPFFRSGNYALVNKLGFGNFRFLGVQILKTTPLINPKRGDVIVFQEPEKPKVDSIKRVIGLPGDSIIYRNKTIYLKQYCKSKKPDCPTLKMIKNTFVSSYLENETELRKHTETLGELEYFILLDPQIKEITRNYFNQKKTGIDKWVVPKKHYFVLGDNRDKSLDSRYFGFVPQKNIIGKVAYVW